MRGLHRCASNDLLLVRKLVARGALLPPWSTSMRQAGCGIVADAIGDFDELNAAGIVGIIDAVIAERDNDRAPAEIVWTGPEPKASAARDTAALVEGMLRSSRSEVLLASYSLDVAYGDEGSLFAPLHEVMRDHGVTAHIFFDVAWVAQRLKRSLKDCMQTAVFMKAFWPFDGTQPHLYFDPRGLDDKHQSNMHAKMLVVDRRSVFIGSANLTDRGTTRSIELGVRLEEPELAVRLVEHWLGTIKSGWLRPTSP